MNRRSFLKSLAVVAAPYVITTAGVLMPVKKILAERPIILWADGVHDDTVALNSFLAGGKVYSPRGELLLGNTLRGGDYKVSDTIVFSANNMSMVNCFINIATKVDPGILIKGDVKGSFIMCLIFRN